MSYTIDHDIQKKIDNGEQDIVISRGIHYVDEPIVIRNTNPVITGENKFHSVIKQVNPDVDIIQVNADFGFAEIGNLTLDYVESPTAGCCVNAENSNNIQIYNILLHQHFIGVKLKSSSNVFLSRLQFGGGKESALWIEGLNDSPCMEIHLRDFIFDGYQGSQGGDAPVNFRSGALHIEGFVDALFFDSGDIARAYMPLFVTDGPPHGVAASPSGCHFSNIYFDSGNVGNVLNYMRHSTFSNCGFTNGFADLAHVNENPGLLIDNCETLRFINCSAYDCRGDGVFVTNTSKRISFIGGNYSNNGEQGFPGVSGIRVEFGTTDFQIIGVTATEGTYDKHSNQNYGIFVEDGPSDRYVIKDNLLHGNQVIGLYDGGVSTEKYIKDNVLGNRPECVMIRNFYLTILNREPDQAGYDAYVNLLRIAQCDSSAAVRKCANETAFGFFNSLGYFNRERSDREYVQDLYLSFLQRMPAANEVDYWVDFLATTTRNTLINFFTGSDEFNTQIDNVILAGCWDR